MGPLDLLASLKLPRVHAPLLHNGLQTVGEAMTVACTRHPQTVQGLMLCNMSEPGWPVLHANQGWQQALPQQGGALAGRHLTDIFPIAEDNKVSFQSGLRCLVAIR